MKRRAGALGVVGWIGVLCALTFVLVATVGRLHGDPSALVTSGPRPPSLAHPFGTDTLGRDLLARTASGAWESIKISAAALGAAVLLAVPLGLLAGWRHGRSTDAWLMRTLETTQAVPMFVLVMFLLGIVGSRWLALCLAVGFVPYFARVTRAATVVELEDDYVEGLQVLGVPTRTILGREVLPNVVPTLAVQVLLAFAIAIFAEGGLSFLGLGVAPPQATLGNLIADAGAQLLDGAWWYATIPGVVMVVGILGCNLIGDVVNDALVAGRELGEAA